MTSAHESGTESASSVRPTSKTPVPPSPRNNVLGQVVMVLMVLALCGGGAWWWSHHEATKKVAPTQNAAMAQEVNFITVARSDAPITLEYLGQTVFSQRVDIRARVKGFLETRSFEEGGRVNSGQVLYTIEQATFKANLDAAKAQLAQAQAHYNQAQREVARFTDLLTRNAASQRELDDWKTNLEVFAADIQSAQAQIKQASLDLDYTVIKSPMDGIISQTKQDVGNYVGDNSAESLLAVVGQDNPMYVQFPVSEQDLLHWRALASSGTVEEEQATLSVQALLSSGEIYPKTGKLNFVDTRVDPATGTAIVRASFDNEDHLLKPGQFIRVKINGLVQKDILAIPQQAVIQSPSGAMVYVVDDQEHAQLRPIMLGSWVGDQWIINQGLNLGDKVIINRLMQLRPGSLVRAVSLPPTDTISKANAQKVPIVKASAVVVE